MNPSRKSCADNGARFTSAARNGRTILVPIDFSEPALKALDYALKFAKRPRASVTLLHVLDESYAAGFVDSDARLKLRSRAIQDAKLNLNLIAASRIHHGVVMECVVRHGNVEYEILRFAEAAGVHLVVLGRKTRNSLGRMLFGSVTAGVMDAAPCAVVVVPPQGATAEKHVVSRATACGANQSSTTERRTE